MDKDWEKLEAKIPSLREEEQLKETLKQFWELGFVTAWIERTRDEIELLKEERELVEENLELLNRLRDKNKTIIDLAAKKLLEEKREIYI